MKKLFLLGLILLMASPVYAVDTPQLDFGGHVRLRGYEMANFWSFNDDADFDNWSTFRLRSDIHVGADVGDNVKGYVRFSNQTYGEGISDAGDNVSDKVFVENAFIDVISPFQLPVSLRLGRQNLMYGTGFVLFDGQSQYASTSIFFDGLKLTWNVTDQTKIDFMYVKDQENNRDDGSDDDITLSGAYMTAKCPVIGGQQEVYILNRSDEGISKDIWMGGLRLSDKFDMGLDYSGEIAYQFGEFHEGENIDQDALGYKLEAGFTFDAPIKPRLFAGYAFMSGDEPDTEDNEAWDVFYGGWPQFGDHLAWVFVNIPPPTPASTATGFKKMSSVIGEAVYTNLMLPKVGLSCALGPVFTEISYTKIMIDEEQAPGADDDFGDYYQFQARYPYSKYLSFACYAAMIEPGDAFASSADESYEFFWETRVNF